MARSSSRQPEIATPTDRVSEAVHRLQAGGAGHGQPHLHRHVPADRGRPRRPVPGRQLECRQVGQARPSTATMWSAPIRASAMTARARWWSAACAAWRCPATRPMPMRAKEFWPVHCHQAGAAALAREHGRRGPHRPRHRKLTPGLKPFVDPATKLVQHRLHDRQVPLVPGAAGGLLRKLIGAVSNPPADWDAWIEGHGR